MNQPTPCAVPECDRQALSTTTEYCSVHYQRIYKTGTPYRHCIKCNSALPEGHGRKKICASCLETHRCSVDGCDQRPQGRGLCKYHWKRWREYGDPQYPDQRAQKKNRKCSVDGCGQRHHANGYCYYHGYRAKKYGNPLAQGPGRGVGRKRMEVPSYAGMHKRLFYDRGKASQLQCVDCGHPAEEWSYDGGCPNEHWEQVRGVWLAYSTNQASYSPRCKKCHRSRDESVTREHDHTGKFIGTPGWIRPLDGSQPATKHYADQHNPPGAHITITTQENQ